MKINPCTLKALPNLEDDGHIHEIGIRVNGLRYHCAKCWVYVPILNVIEYYENIYGKEKGREKAIRLEEGKKLIKKEKEWCEIELEGFVTEEGLKKLERLYKK